MTNNMNKENLSDSTRSRLLSVPARMVELIAGHENFIRKIQSKRAYKKRREAFINAPFSPDINPEFFRLVKPEMDPNIIEGEFTVIESRKLLEPPSPDQG